jgi:hypothetical protein
MSRKTRTEDKDITAVTHPEYLQYESHETIRRYSPYSSKHVAAY